MSRLPVAAFVALAAATIGAFFVTQHLKVSTPLIAGFPAPDPSAINPADGQVCRVRLRTGGLESVSHRSMSVSFYLLNRSDDVDVYIVDTNGTIVATLASGRHMRGGTAHPVRALFRWNGREDDGSLAPDGTYFIRVSLIHQGRSVLISNTAGPEPVTVETVPPRPRVTAVTPALIPQPHQAKATIRYSPRQAGSGRILIYRTDLGPAHLVGSYAAGGRGGISSWDGTIGGHPAPQGTYLVGLEITDKACNTGRFPPELPPVAGTTAHAGVSVRYLAAQPPLSPVAAGQSATVLVDARQHAYRWTLSHPGAKTPLATGAASGYQLRVPLPRSGPGLYELRIHWGSHQTAVPLIAGPAGGAAAGPARILVVLPALTWQGANPVDDDGNGLPNTLVAGDQIELQRPLVGGLPAGFDNQAALLAYLHKAGLPFDLTTDVALTQGTAPGLAGHSGVVLAGDEHWWPTALGASLRAYVTAGGRVLSLGIDSLRRSVTVAAGRAFAPTGPHGEDILGARPGNLTDTRGALILAGQDGLGIFSGTSGAWAGYRSHQPFAPVVAGTPVASQAGVSSLQPAIIGYRLGRGIVVDIGLPGFGSSLARNFDARQLLARIWSVLGH